MTPDDHLRILRAATHWAATTSRAFGDIILHCVAPLPAIRAEGGAVVLQGATADGLPVSICLAQGPNGPEVRLLHSQVIRADGFAAIRTTEIHLTLPRYLARQLVPQQAAA